MSPEVFVQILRESMFMVILLVSAVIVPSMIVGLIVAVFQAATSINAWGGNWLVEQLMDFTFHMVEQIPQVVG